MKTISGFLWVVMTFAILVSCEKDDGQHPHAFLESEVAQKINAHRLSLNLQELAIHDDITEQARKHSDNMAKGIISFGHEGFVERIEIIKRSLSGINRSAENVLYGSDDADAAIGAWLQSEEHKNNLEGNYTHSGIGIAQDKDGNYFYTQIFVGTK